MNRGSAPLVSFNAAPAGIQSAFWRAIAEQTIRERDFRRYQAEVDEPGPPPAPCERLRPLVTWDERWRARSARFRREQAEGTIVGFATERDRLRSIPADEYVPVLTGVEPVRGKMHCPLHDERTPSFTVRDTTWRCWGCDADGDIYALAGALWASPLTGGHFKAVHRRLVETFGA